MDHFGIGLALRGVAQVYFHGARRSGRTTSLIESLKTGDRVLFAEPREAERVRKLCLDRGVEIECIVAGADRAHETLFNRGTPEGRTVFDHTWVELYYQQALDRAAREIDHMQRESSGFGEAHRETAVQAAAARDYELMALGTLWSPNRRRAA